MSHYTLNYPLEKSLFHLLQVTFGEVMHKIFTDLDAAIAEQRDKKRFQMKDKRLREQGEDTTGMRPMGSAEATMSVFAKRLKISPNVSAFTTPHRICLKTIRTG